MSNINEDKQSKLCYDPGDILRAFAVGLPQHRMKVCYATYDRFQQIPLVIFREQDRQSLTGAKSRFGVKIWTRIGGSCLGFLQIKTMSNISEEI